MKTKQIDEILKQNPSASLDELMALTHNQRSRETLRKRRTHLGLPPYQVNCQNAESVFSRNLEEAGLDQHNWKHGWLKTQATSIFVRNKDGIVSYEDMRESLIEEMKAYAPKYPKLTRPKIKDGHMLVIDPADIHIGKISLPEETGDRYDIKLAKQRCLDGVEGILTKAQGFPIEKILFVMGNDILHTDNPKHTTTAGTVVDSTSLWWNAYREAKDLYIKILERLVMVADVEVVYCPSNHDYASGFMLTDSISSWFRNNKNITFQNNIMHRKYVEYGLNLLGFDHGDGAKEKESHNILAQEAREAWGRTKFGYIYKHHIHHKKRIKWADGEDFVGVTVEYLRSPSAPDGWHHRNGYVAPKAVEGFIHHPKQGQVCRLTHYF